MGSLRTPGIGETVASDIQPAGSHNESETIQNVGGMVWEPGAKKWEPAVSSVSDASIADTVPLTTQGSLNQAGSIDRHRNNSFALVAFALAERTTTVATSEITNYNWSKILLKLHVLKNPGEGRTLIVSLFAEPLSQLIFRFPAVSESRVFMAGPGLPQKSEGNSGGALTENSVIPGKFVIQVKPSDAEPWEYEMTYGLLV